MTNNESALKIFDEEKNLDKISKLNSMNFFTLQYNNFINKHPNSNLIFFDFTKFKRINDEFLHQAGDACLASFGRVINSVFPDSLATRKHGDEFLILTYHSYSELPALFEKCKQIIQDHFDLGIIPVLYGFNAGIVPAEHGINPTIEKADIMMYEAKKRGLTYLNFDQNMYNIIKNDKKFIKKTSQAIINDELPLAKRFIHQINKDPANILDVYTRDFENNKLFTDHRLKLLRESGELKKLDFLNLKKIIMSSSVPYGKKIMINIFANSLFNAACPFPRFINALSNIMTGTPENYIICVNVSDFNEKIDELIDYFKLLRSLGFEVALSGFDLSGYNPLLNIWPRTDAKFIKVNPSLWKLAQENKRYESVLNYNIQAFLDNGISPIFMKIEKDEDLDFIKNISSRSLFEGNIADKEEQISFK